MSMASEPALPGRPAVAGGRHRIELRSVSAGYHGHRVLTGVSFVIETPAIYVVLGPNGAGKTTLFRTLAGILEPYSGSVEIDGTRMGRGGARAGIQYLSHIDGIPDGLRVEEALRFYATVEGVGDREVDRVIRMLGIAELRTRVLLRTERGPEEAGLDRTGLPPGAGDLPPRRADREPRPEALPGDPGPRPRAQQGRPRPLLLAQPVRGERDRQVRARAPGREGRVLRAPQRPPTGEVHHRDPGRRRRGDPSVDVEAGRVLPPGAGRTRGGPEPRRRARGERGPDPRGEGDGEPARGPVRLGEPGSDDRPARLGTSGTGRTGPSGDSSSNSSAENLRIVVPARRHASGGRPAFSQVCARNSSGPHPYSTATCGNRSPLAPDRSTMSPSRPTTTWPGRPARGSLATTVGTVRIDTSRVTPAISSAATGGNRGSSTAAAQAARGIATRRG